MNKKTYGIISILAGGILGIYCLVTISNDVTPKGLLGERYTYESPLTSHEMTMILLCIAAVIAIIFGVCLLCLVTFSHESDSEDESTWDDSSNSIYNVEKSPTHGNSLLQNGGWKCICGRINPSYTGTCACGKRKNTIQTETEKKENQSRRQTQTSINEEDMFEKTRKYKELLDSGIITEEEFNKKKKELLGL